ncbi:ABC-F type ribosomal protection protein [Anaerotignum faecicola]|nr:ABC-F type ribosomal protection protein [Anaerotignum faecicola]
MSLINVSNLTFSYPGSFDNVFENVSFQIDTDWKLGFTGRNGRGKTTFLKLLLNEYEFGGSISSDVEFMYFPFNVKDGGALAFDIAAEFCPNAMDWEIIREVSLLEADAELLYHPFNTLSKGECTKILLAAMFLNENKFLLIDEPTNHLDMHAREAAAKYLNSKKGFILVSHDRAFLDMCTDHTLSINKTDIEIQKGNFSSWFENKKRTDAFEFAENEKLKKDIGRLEASARKKAEWSYSVEKTKFAERNSGLRPDRGYIGHKAAKMMKRSKSIENRRQNAVEEKCRLLKNIEVSDTLKISQLSYRKTTLAELKDISIYYGEKEVCRGVSLKVENGKRISLSGHNGSGKSSVLKLILGEDIKYRGYLNIGSGLKISYVPQDTSFLKGSLSDYAAEKGIDEHIFKAILRKLDFSREQFRKDMEFFSEGQKKKTLIAASLCEKAHLHIWDEPLNFIDVISRMQIEELILANNPTLLFVEHDRNFCKKIADDIIEIGR